MEITPPPNQSKKQSLIRYKFLKQYDIHLDIEKPLWNVEFELKREFLKSYKIDTVEQCLQSVNVLHSELMKRIRLMTKKRKVDETVTRSLIEDILGSFQNSMTHVICGVWNARIGNLSPTINNVQVQRKSDDPTTNGRAPWLIERCEL